MRIARNAGRTIKLPDFQYRLALIIMAVLLPSAALFTQKHQPSTLKNLGNNYHIDLMVGFFEI